MANGKFSGLRYLAPAYGKDNARLKEFLAHYAADHKREPLITFHTAATVDTLDLLQSYLDEAKVYDKNQFQLFLLTKVKNYHGLLGDYSIDAKGNADTGFVAARID